MNLDLFDQVLYQRDLAFTHSNSPNLELLNSTHSEYKQTRFSAYLLQYTFFKMVTRNHGVEYTKKLAGHTSDAENESVLEDLF